MIMLISSFFSWWYGRGWKQVLQSFGPRLKSVSNNFSVDQLVRTWFEPWRRIITYPGASLEDKMRAWGDNLFSRIIGFTVRSLVLLGALITSVAVGALTVLEILAWPLLPVAPLILIIMGLSA